MTPDTLPPELQGLATILARLSAVEAEVRAIKAAKPVPAVIPLRDFPAWYQRATGAPEHVLPVTEHQLRRWAERPEHFGVDWLIRDGRALLVDAGKFGPWRQRMGGSGAKVRVRGVRG